MTNPSLTEALLVLSRRDASHTEAESLRYTVLMHAPGLGVTTEEASLWEPTDSDRELVGRGADFDPPRWRDELKTLIDQVRTKGFSDEDVRRRVGVWTGERLFPGSVRTLFHQSWAASRKRLRLRVVIDDPALADYPWETALLDVDCGHLVDQPGLRFVRESVLTPDELSSAPVLSDPTRATLLIMDASTADGTRLNSEVESIQRSWTAGPVTVVEPRKSSLEEIRRTIRHTRPTIFHYCGHAHPPSPDTPASFELPGENLSSFRCTGDKLGRLLARAGVRLAILNACSTAQSAPGHRSFIDEVVASGVDAAVGWSTPSRDIVEARPFAEALYRSLADTGDVECAVTDARSSLEGARTAVTLVTATDRARAQGRDPFRPVHRTSITRPISGADHIALPQRPTLRTTARGIADVYPCAFQLRWRVNDHEQALFVPADVGARAQVRLSAAATLSDLESDAVPEDLRAKIPSIIELIKHHYDLGSVSIETLRPLNPIPVPHPPFLQFLQKVACVGAVVAATCHALGLPHEPTVAEGVCRKIGLPAWPTMSSNFVILMTADTASILRWKPRLAVLLLKEHRPDGGSLSPIDAADSMYPAFNSMDAALNRLEASAGVQNSDEFCASLQAIRRQLRPTRHPAPAQIVWGAIAWCWMPDAHLALLCKASDLQNLKDTIEPVHSSSETRSRGAMTVEAAFSVAPDADT